jgi:hypothetical protein
MLLFIGDSLYLSTSYSELGLLFLLFFCLSDMQRRCYCRFFKCYSYYPEFPFPQHLEGSKVSSFLSPSSNIFSLASYLLDIKSEIDTIERWMVCLVSAKKSSWSLLGCLPFFDHAPNIEYLFSHFLDELQEPKLCPIFCLANQTRPKSL